MNSNFYTNPIYPNMYNNDSHIIHNYLENNKIPITNNKTYSIEELLKNNSGKYITVYLSFPSSVDWRDVKISGILDKAFMDYIIIRNSKDNVWKIIPTKYIDYIESEEILNDIIL